MRGHVDMRGRWTGEHDPRYRNPDAPAKGSSKDKGKDKTKSKGKSSSEKGKAWGFKGAKEGGWADYRPQGGGKR